MTALQEPPPRLDNDEMLRVEIDGNNNANEKFLRKQFSQQIEDEVNYSRLREENLDETEIDEFISQMLIDNLNNVIKTVNENLQANGERNLVKIDYCPAMGEVEESGGDNKFEKQHEISIQMRNDKNGDNENSQNSSPAVERGSCEEANESPEKHQQQHFYGYYGKF